MTDSCDFPAAHSMDTMWFAVDADGHVAAFDSGESGAVPNDAYLGEDYGEVVDAILLAQGVARNDPDFDDFEDEPYLRKAGVYFYSEEDGSLAGLYARQDVPTKRLSASALPPQAKEALVTFAGRFDETPKLQPVEHWPSSAWGAAYLASDGKTVRCIPGMEDQYADHTAHLTKDRASEGLVVEPARVDGKPYKKPWWKLW